MASIDGEPRRPETKAAQEVERIYKLLSGWSLRHSSEDELQRAIAYAFERSGEAAQREVRVTAGDRLDFLVGGVGIEVKLFGSRTAVGRQMLRYAMSDVVTGLLLVTTKRQHLGLPGVLAGVPLATLHVGAIR